MKNKIENFTKKFLKESLPELKSGDTVRIYQKIQGGEEKKSHIIEGLILARKHGKEMGSTITIRKVIAGIGTERIIPLHSPLIEKIEIMKRGKTRRSKLYYLRTAKGKKAKLKNERFKEVIAEEPTIQIKTPRLDSIEEKKEK
jgi:large subunit ribosomal protein L19